MPKTSPPDVRVIFDTQDNVVHLPICTTSYWEGPQLLEGIDEFTAYLNVRRARNASPSLPPAHF